MYHVAKIIRQATDATAKQMMTSIMLKEIWPCSKATLSSTDWPSLVLPMDATGPEKKLDKITNKSNCAFGPSIQIDANHHRVSQKDFQQTRKSRNFAYILTKYMSIFNLTNFLKKSWFWFRANFESFFHSELVGIGTPSKFLDKNSKWDFSYNFQTQWTMARLHCP